MLIIAHRVENNTALLKNRGETIAIDSDVSIHNVVDCNACTDDCIGDRDDIINDNVVNESVDENPVVAHVDSAFKNVIPRRSTRVREPVIKYGVVPYEGMYC